MSESLGTYVLSGQVDRLLTESGDILPGSFQLLKRITFQRPNRLVVELELGETLVSDLTTIETAIAQLQSELPLKADAEHSHSINDVVDLNDLLIDNQNSIAVLQSRLNEIDSFLVNELALSLIQGLITNQTEREVLSNEVRFHLAGGVMEFRRSTKPTERPAWATANGQPGPLVTGDRWYHTDQNLWFFWNGNYWVTEQRYEGVINGSSGSFTIRNNANLILESFSVSGVAGGSNNASNFSTFTLSRRNANGVTTEATVNTSAIAAGAGFNLAVSLGNVHRDVAALNLIGFTVTQTATGSPGSLTNTSSLVRYRIAHP
jgi:hypothetical protein